MSNSSSHMNMTLSLEQLLDKLGFYHWQTITASFILPIINLIGLSFCSLSAWIFFRRKFANPIYFYYRLLCLVYILHLVHNFLAGLLFSPRYFTRLNTYLSSLYQVYYFLISGFFFLFEEFLQMGILLSRIKFFSPFLAKHFKASPKTNSLIFFISCFFVYLPIFFSFKIAQLSNHGYYYFDLNGVKQTSLFYFGTNSDFSVTLFGKIIIAFSSFFLRLTLPLVASFSLNIFSILKFKSYIRERRSEFEELEMSSIHNRPVTSREAEQINRRELSRRQIEQNMLYMAITLCTVSIVSRVLIVLSYVYFRYFYSFTDSLTFMIILYTIYTFVPTVAIFIFYSFNQMFRKEMRRVFFKTQIDEQIYD